MVAYRLLDPGPLTAAQNMCLDEVLTARAGRGDTPPTLRFLQFSPASALVGFNQETQRELRLTYCRENGIDINRRVTGGGALLFEESVLGWELIAPLGTEPFSGGFENALGRICRSAARGFRRLGLDAHFRPRNDIEVDGRKISGTGGTVIQGGAMFQGTVLVKNRIEVFLRALRVPVEKLKKREIDSLMERLAFVEDLLGRELDLAELKQALAAQFAHDLGLELYSGDLSADEQAELDQRLPYFESDEWVYGRQRAEREPAWLRSIQQSEGGVLRVRLWLDRTGRLVQKAFISGDFFCRPQRLVLDLEAALLGARAQPEGLYRLVHDFLTQYPGEIADVPIKEVAGAVAGAARRTCLAKDFAALEAADLFFVGMQPDDLHGLDLRWLLLPYCSKPVDCDLRLVADCDVCGQCQFTPMYELAEEMGITPVSIQSFEHLMEALAVAREKGGDFVGSCCEAFYSKHQREMEESGTKGVLINLDSTTCYDLGKGMEAYVGRFDHQTEMNTDLIEKVVRTIVKS